MIMARVEFDNSFQDLRLAYIAEGPPDDRVNTGFFWLGGFKSEMTGSKAEHLAALSRATRRSMFRFDYSGHGQSSGEFTDGTISGWLEQSAHMFASRTRGKRVLVGSSMGGWLSLLLIKKLAVENLPALRRIAGLVLLAPAADMTEDLMWNRFTIDQKDQMEELGLVELPSDYGSPYPITRDLIEDGRRHLLLKSGIHVPFPVRILQGDRDADVPPSHAVKTMQAISADDVTLTYIKGGDHRLSSPIHLRLLGETLMALAERADGSV
jgi:pimeloyl-ACP methyl ester carboxylesterase